MSKEKLNHSNKKLVVIIAILLVAIIGGTYAWLALTIFGKNTNTIVAGTLSLKLDEHEYIDISGADAIPSSKETALSKDNNVYNFELENDGNVDSEYTIYLDIETEDDNTIPTDAIRYILTKNDISNEDKLLSEAPTEILGGDNQGKLILDSSNLDSNSQVLKPKDKNKYSLRLWIDSNATESISGKTFSAKIKIVATQTDIE